MRNLFYSYMPEEKLREDNFVKNTTRLSDSRFCVGYANLSLSNPSVLGKFNLLRKPHIVYSF